MSITQLLCNLSSLFSIRSLVERKSRQDLTPWTFNQNYVIMNDVYIKPTQPKIFSHKSTTFFSSKKKKKRLRNIALNTCQAVVVVSILLTLMSESITLKMKFGLTWSSNFFSPKYRVEIIRSKILRSTPLLDIKIDKN